ncbi:MAG: collagen-like protein [Candidatus Caenarcaniphilales bacterium]|jgi:hypothetical protein|nr:collagen-like protein [Candidatus Caenarcaniphilales bacterium]
MRKTILLTSLLAITSPVLAKIKSNVPNVFVSGETTKVKGDEINSDSNPFKAVVETLDGLTINLPVVINKKDNRANIQMPTVDEDSKVILKLSGGNIPEAKAQQYLVLILSKPESFVQEETSISEEDVSIPETSTGGFEGPAGPQGPQGPNGPQGPAGPQGTSGAAVVHGGNLDANVLPVAIYMPALVTGSESGSVEINRATFFTISDSDNDNTNILYSLTGAKENGAQVTILINSDLQIYDANAYLRVMPLEKKGLVSLKVEPNINLQGGYESGKFGTQYFNRGTVLVLVYNNGSWYEVSRSNTNDIR